MALRLAMGSMTMMRGRNRNPAAIGSDVPVPSGPAQLTLAMAAVNLLDEGGPYTGFRATQTGRCRRRHNRHGHTGSIPRPRRVDVIVRFIPHS